jgi:hypothetical protein
MKKVAVLTGCVIALVAGVAANQGGGTAPAAQLPTSIAAEVNGYFTAVAGNITKSAAMVPEDMYRWQPTPEVRSFARLFGHIVDDNNGACWSLAGEAQRPAVVDTPNSAESGANKLKKAEIEQALAASVALCQKAFAAVTPANMMESAGGRGNRTRIGNLIYNTSHINEHYGNMVTYLRLKGMVPPSSAPRGGGPAQ